MKFETAGPPMTLGSAAAAKVRLTDWCKACGHRSEPDPAEQARWYGPETTVPDWCARLVCSRCGSRDVDMVVSGTRCSKINPPTFGRPQVARGLRASLARAAVPPGAPRYS